MRSGFVTLVVLCGGVLGANHVGAATNLSGQVIDMLNNLRFHGGYKECLEDFMKTCKDYNYKQEAVMGLLLEEFLTGSLRPYSFQPETIMTLSSDGANDPLYELRLSRSDMNIWFSVNGEYPAILKVEVQDITGIHEDFIFMCDVSKLG